MVARVHTQVGLTVAFHRGGEEVESEVASTGERARRTAIVMLARQDFLQDGDRLTITETKLSQVPAAPRWAAGACDQGGNTMTRSVLFGITALVLAVTLAYAEDTYIA